MSEQMQSHNRASTGEASHVEVVAARPAPKPALRRGWLRNGNAPGDFHNCARCGAKTRKGTACRAPAMPNGRCRMHGGASTGPRTPQGRARCAEAHTIDGSYEKQNVEDRRISQLSRRATTIELDIGSRQLLRLAASAGIDVSSLATPGLLRLNVREQLDAKLRVLTKLWSIASFRNSQTGRQRRAFRRNLAEVAEKLARLQCQKRNRKQRGDQHE